MPDVTFPRALAYAAGLRRKRAARDRADEAAHPGSTFTTPAEWNRLDARDLAYHQRVAAGFAELMRRDPGRWRRDALLEPVSTVVWLHEVGAAGFEVVLK